MKTRLKSKFDEATPSAPLNPLQSRHNYGIDKADLFKDSEFEAISLLVAKNQSFNGNQVNFFPCFQCRLELSSPLNNLYLIIHRIWNS